MNGKHLLIGISILGLALAAAPNLHTARASQPARPRADFNGDGRADLAGGGRSLRRRLGHDQLLLRRLLLTI